MSPSVQRRSVAPAAHERSADVAGSRQVARTAFRVGSPRRPTPDRPCAPPMPVGAMRARQPRLRRWSTAREQAIDRARVRDRAGPRGSSAGSGRRPRAGSRRAVPGRSVRSCTSGSSSSSSRARVRSMSIDLLMSETEPQGACGHRAKPLAARRRYLISVSRPSQSAAGPSRATRGRRAAPEGGRPPGRVGSPGSPVRRLAAAGLRR